MQAQRGWGRGGLEGVAWAGTPASPSVWSLPLPEVRAGHALRLPTPACLPPRPPALRLARSLSLGLCAHTSLGLGAPSFLEVGSGWLCGSPRPSLRGPPGGSGGCGAVGGGCGVKGQAQREALPRGPSPFAPWSTACLLLRSPTGQNTAAVLRPVSFIERTALLASGLRGPGFTSHVWMPSLGGGEGEHLLVLWAGPPRSVRRPALPRGTVVAECLFLESLLSPGPVL